MLLLLLLIVLGNGFSCDEAYDKCINSSENEIWSTFVDTYDEFIGNDSCLYEFMACKYLN